MLANPDQGCNIAYPDLRLFVERQNVVPIDRLLGPSLNASTATKTKSSEFSQLAGIGTNLRANALQLPHFLGMSPNRCVDRPLHQFSRGPDIFALQPSNPR